MHITKTDEATPNTQSQFMHSILKTTITNGFSQQVIKRHDGNFLNVDFDAIHSIDL